MVFGKKKKDVIPISREARVCRMEDAAKLLNDHVKPTSPSIALPLDFRWAVALESRHALNCKGCAKLAPEGTCTRDSAVLATFKSVKHTHDFDSEIPYSVTDHHNCKSWPVVQRIVHMAINHQSRINGYNSKLAAAAAGIETAPATGKITGNPWYDKTLASLDKTSLIPKSIPAGDHREYLVATLLAEIIGTIANSHMISTAFRAMGKDIPKLDAWPQYSEDATANNAGIAEPTHQDVVTSGMLKNGRKIRYDKSVLGAPHVLNQDYDTKSPAFMALDPHTQETLSTMMMNLHPLVGLSLCPRDAALVRRLTGLLSLTDEEGGAPWKKLDGTHYCIDDGWTRYDFETIMTATSKFYGTQYCLDFHQAMKLGLASTETASERELLLVLLAQVASTKPFSEQAFERVVTMTREQLGPSTLIEAAGVLAKAEAWSKATDLMHKPPPPPFMVTMFRRTTKILKRFH